MCNKTSKTSRVRLAPAVNRLNDTADSSSRALNVQKRIIPMAIVLLGNLDTKGVEFQFVRDLLKAQNLETLVIDAGVLGPPQFMPDVLREEVFSAAGTTHGALVKA